MAGLDDLAALLAQSDTTQKAISAENPFLSFQSVPDSIGQAILGANQRDPLTGDPLYPTKDRILGALLAGIVSGGVKSLGENYQADTTSEYEKALAAQLGGSTEKPEGLSSSLFKSAENEAKVFKAKLGLQQAEDARKFQAERAGKLQDALLDVGLVMTNDGGIAKISQLDPAEQAKLKKIGEIQGANLGWGADASQNPDSPQFKALKAIRDEEDAARAEIAKLPAVQGLQLTSTALSKLKGIKDINTASSDIPFATIFIQGLDGSTVREGEYLRVAGANPILAKFQNQLEGALNGTSTLGVNIKKQMYEELVKTQQGLLAESVRASKSRLDTALSRGVLNAANALPFDPQMTFDIPSSLQQNAGTLSPGNIVTAPDGRRILIK